MTNANTDRNSLPLMLDQQQLVSENKLLKDQLDHAQGLLATAGMDYSKLDEHNKTLNKMIDELQKELIQVYRDKAALNRKISDLLSRSGEPKC